MKLRTILPLLLAVLVVLPAVAEDKQPVTHEAIWMMKRVGSPVPSPDGRRVIFEITVPDYDPKKETSDLWIVTTTGSEAPRRLTATKGGEGNPVWSPDSTRIAFTAKREDAETTQIYVMDLARGGDPIQITSSAMSARRPRWSPDGTKLLYESSLWPGATDDESNAKIDKEREDAKSSLKAYEGFPIRAWDRWRDESSPALFVIDAKEGATSRNLLADAELVKQPGFAGGGGRTGDSLQGEWAPDGKSIVFTATTEQNKAAFARVHSHIYTISLDGGEPVALTAGDVDYGNPRFRPDGKALCFNTRLLGDALYANVQLACAGWPWDRKITNLTADLDRSPEAWDFAPDSRTIYFTADDAGLTHIHAVSTSGGTVERVIEAEAGQYGGLAIAEKAKGTMLFANWGSAVNPSEVFRVDLSSKTRKNLSNVNVEAAAAIDWLPPRHFWFTNEDGLRIHSMIVLPPAFDESKKYPLLVMMHGGHASMWSDAIHLRWNYHLLGAPGYVVLLTDYRGSTGYGIDFTLAIHRDPLEGPAKDINDAADEAIRLYPFIDGDRQAAAGASYGGHLANWMEATTTRYKCIISHAGLSSLSTQWGTSDAVYHREVMIGGPPWKNDPLWKEQSPITYADNFKTPMMLSIGERDYRVPLSNTLEMWTVLQRQQVPSRLLYWPDENHWIMKPENSKRFYEEFHAWVERWIRD
jgi:dipeptidyl aminopeptidase/acylaminoacyl peptidase